MSVINTNISSMQAQNSLRASQGSLATAMERLSSGVRINSAKDDAAGLAISTRMTASIRGIGMAVRNANDGISLMQTAEGSMSQISETLQRIRELAVQSANAGNSTSDRAAMNNEAKQLIAEIDRVAGNTKFNSINLLDGSFKGLGLQVGSGNSATDRILISIASAKSTSLGVGTDTSYASKTTGSAVGATALVAGALAINGYSVGAATANGVSVASAINAITGSTGVTATTQATTTAGTTVTQFATAIADGNVKINGVSIGAISAASTAGGRGGQVAAAINAISDQTGVTATFDTSTGAVALTAADGRNIAVETKNAGSSVLATGLGSGTVQAVAGTTLTDVTSITLADGLKINGVAIATATDPTVVTTQGSAAGPTVTESSVITFSALAAGQATTVNGITFTAGTAGVTADQVATAFASLTSGQLLASVQSTHVASDALGDYSGTAFTAGFTTGTTTGALVTATSSVANSNVTDISVALSVTTKGSNVAAAINALTSQTGVTAVNTAGSVALTSAGGVSVTGNVTAKTGISQVSEAVTTSRSTVELSSVGSAGINIAGLTSAALTAAGLVEGSATVTSSTGKGVSAVDLTTVAGAQAALTTLDSAINAITESRGMMGAYQNRLTASISNLETTSMNLSASRSRIVDTDYAQETTNLAKTQIISQAATAMLAQANQSQQSVLALLK